VKNLGSTVTVLVRGSNELTLGEADRSLHGPGPPGAVTRPSRFPSVSLVFPTVTRFCTARLHGRARRLTAQHGGFRRGQTRSA
jgi:hypothetical protein